MYFSFFGVSPGGPPPSDAFILEIDTRNISVGSSSSNRFSIPTVDEGTYDCTVYWGDDTSSDITSWNDADLTHTYAVEGTYTITISGQFKGFKFNNSGDKLKVLEVTKFGPDFKLGGWGYTFYGCENLDITPSDALNDKPTSLYLALANCILYNSPLTWLDSSGALTMLGLFLGCTSFNQDISILDFSNTDSVYALLSGCTSFNQDLIINTSNKLKQCRAMLTNCGSFNSDLDFNTENVTDFSGFLHGCTTFNKSLENIDFSRGMDLGNLLFNCTSFNQDLPLDMSSATNLERLCTQCTALVSADLSGKDLSEVTNMNSAFYGCTALTTINLTGTNIGTHLLTLTGFASNCAALTDIVGLDTLDISNVYRMDYFLYNASIPTARYSGALIYWATLTLQEDVVCDMGSSKYNALGETAKNYIIANFNWTFIDGGLVA